jgi:septum formation protein
MLRRLSGRTHSVYTGVAVSSGVNLSDAVCETAYEKTEVRFAALCDREIAAYVSTGEPLDKAGAYGIQGRGALLVEGISGDFYNVIGLPLRLLGGMLEKVGIDLLRGVE